MNRLKQTEIKQMSSQELLVKLLEMRREYFKLRLDASTSHVKSFPSDKRHFRKNIARLLTQLNTMTMSQQ